jgi:endonuclease/exonuclease/phosphatase family metal-dependent hydrolase
MQIFVIAIILVFLVPSGAAYGDGTAKVGDRVELKATHHDGIPLHKEPHSTHDFQRVPHGTAANVMETAQDGRWLKLQFEDRKSGWISTKYVGRIVSGDQLVPSGDIERQVWGSPEGCQQVVGAGGRMPKNNASALRIGTWNIRWFPKGCSPDEQCPENATDTTWLACTIAWMNVEVLAVQEVMNTREAKLGLQVIRTELDHLTNGAWQTDLQRCGSEAGQHVGFLWNSRRVALQNQADVAELNGASTGTSTTACAGNLRPGRYAHVKVQNGVDFHLLSVHLDSGTSNKDYQNRRTAIDRIGTLSVNGTPLLTSDPDVVVVGDYNTMGRKEAPSISPHEEISTFEEELAPGFRRRLPTPSCSEYFDGKPGVLDHVVVSAGMQEAAATSRVTGYCAVENCRDSINPMPRAYEKLSDHCPTVFEVQNSDVD